MNPFTNPEFWLSACFCMVLGLIIIPPVRKILKKSFNKTRQKIELQITQANEVYKTALQMHRKILNDLKNNPQDSTQHQIHLIKNEFTTKEENQKKILLQDFEIRKSLIQQETKNHLRKSLLDDTEKNIKSCNKTSPQDVAHLIQVLHENKEALIKILD